MATLTFHSLKALAAPFGGTVYRDLHDDSLLVQDVTHNCWHRYRWTQGQREIKYVQTLLGSELPIMLQIYPSLGQ
jgi:hypothetical protein